MYPYESMKFLNYGQLKQRPDCHDLEHQIKFRICVLNDNRNKC